MSQKKLKYNKGYDHLIVDSSPKFKLESIFEDVRNVVDRALTADEPELFEASILAAETTEGTEGVVSTVINFFAGEETEVRSYPVRFTGRSGNETIGTKTDGLQNPYREATDIPDFNHIVKDHPQALYYSNSTSESIQQGQIVVVGKRDGIWEIFDVKQERDPDYEIWINSKRSGIKKSTQSNFTGGSKPRKAQTIDDSPSPDAFAVQEYKDLGFLAQDILIFISNHESGGADNIFNWGTTDGPPGYIKDIETYTVSEILALQRTGKGKNNTSYEKNGKFPFAVGRYQIVPNTMSYILDTQPEFKDEKFTVDTQRGLAAVLIFNKQPKLGNYISGTTNDIDQAILALSREWAFAPVPFSIAKKTYGEWPKVDLQRGMSFYSGAGGNKAGTQVASAANAINISRNEFDKAFSSGPPSPDSTQTAGEIIDKDPAPTE